MASGTSIDTSHQFKRGNCQNKGPLKMRPNLSNDSNFLFGKNNTNNKGHHKSFTSHRNSQKHHDTVSHKRRFTYSGNTQDNKRAFKRRRCSGVIVPPTKFLLGGNINDPLNLESLADEEINKKLNEPTPYSSPVPQPKHREQIEVLIPQNINDPLNLNSGEDIEFKLISPKTKKKRKQKQKKKNVEIVQSMNEEKPKELDAIKVDSMTTEEEVTAKVMPIVKEMDRPNTLISHQLHLHMGKFNQDRAMDKIVSPVVPQGSPIKYHRRFRSWSFSKDHEDKGKTGKKNTKKQQANEPKFRKKDEQFRYGNYNRYYGYRFGPLETEDPRLKCMKTEWFKGLDILDIGCNVGYLTLSIARDFEVRKIIGIDIDNNLIKVARKNVRHYLTNNAVTEVGDAKVSDFPISMALCHGPIATTVLPNSQETRGKFPNNVFFVNGNYVLETDGLLELQRSEYDTILCLSITKWIQLNFGDAGLKRAFKRMYANLRPGGRLILEPQPWQSYSRKKKMTETIYKNFHAIKFKPEQFNEYLLSSEVGFSTCELIDTPAHQSKGFCRPLYLFTKNS